MLMFFIITSMLSIFIVSSKGDRFKDTAYKIVKSVSGVVGLAFEEIMYHNADITSFEITRDDDLYIAEIKIKNAYGDLDSITINNQTYTKEESLFYSYEDKEIVMRFYLDVVFQDFERNKMFRVNSFIIKERIYEQDVRAFAIRPIDNAIIREKSKGIVGIESKQGTKIVWGSGVMFFKTTEKGSFFTGYQDRHTYYILTNAHVVEGNKDFMIHVGMFGNIYPQSALDKVELVGLYKDNADIAILKLTTFDELSIVVDNQFQTRELIPIKKDMNVFSIGSPSLKTSDGSDDISFNAVKEGVVLTTSTTVYLPKSDNVCINGCSAFETSASLGQGSSGGAVFDEYGNMIGLHFAGNKNNTVSSEIPMTTVMKAVDALLPGLMPTANIYIKEDFQFVEIPFFYVIALHNQHFQSLL